MSYTYDVFFSYKRQTSTSIWYEGLIEKLEFWLEHELHRPVNIFFDSEDIQTGMRWRQKISEGLNQSKCIVCLWSPLYFRSKWCVAEWQTFEARAQACECDLIVPARFFDGEFYPTEAKAIQRQDFSKYTSTSPRFWDTELAHEFEQKELKKFALAIANIVRNAPPHSQDFPLIEEPDPSLVLSEPEIGAPVHD